jgi:hypothetical protein
MFGPGSNYLADMLEGANSDATGRSIGIIVNAMILLNAIWIAISGALAGLVTWGISPRDGMGDSDRLPSDC